MRIAELSRTADVPLATIKYYLREGLLPPGDRAGAANQADYGERHVHRLHLIRTLLQVGGLSIADVRAVVQALDDPAVDEHHMLGAAHTALPGRGGGFGAASAGELDAARSEVVNFLAERGWPAGELPVQPLDALATALVALRRLGRDVGPDVFAPYAEAADALAEQELGTIESTSPGDRMVEDAVIGTVVFESVLIALRRLAHARHSAARFGNARAARG